MNDPRCVQVPLLIALPCDSFSPTTMLDCPFRQHPSWTDNQWDTHLFCRSSSPVVRCKPHTIIVNECGVPVGQQASHYSGERRPPEPKQKPALPGVGKYAQDFLRQDMSTHCLRRQKHGRSLYSISRHRQVNLHPLFGKSACQQRHTASEPTV